MKTFLIQIKEHPCLYVGKKNPTYALTSDKAIKNGMIIDPTAHWFAPRHKAKIWTDPLQLRNFVNRYNKGETHNHYNVEIDNNGKLSQISLDDFVADPKRFC